NPRRATRQKLFMLPRKATRFIPFHRSLASRQNLFTSGITFQRINPFSLVKKSGCKNTRVEGNTSLTSLTVFRIQFSQYEACLHGKQAAARFRCQFVLLRAESPIYFSPH